MGICASSTASAELNGERTPIKGSISNPKEVAYLAPIESTNNVNLHSPSSPAQYVVTITAATPKAETRDLSPASPTVTSPPSPSPSDCFSPEPQSPIQFTEYTLDEVKTHKTRSSCWTVVDGMVYDLTSYLPNHPGGDTIVLSKMGGKDGTASFNSMHDDSQTAKDDLKQCLIGKLVDAASKSQTPSPASVTAVTKPVEMMKDDYSYTITAIRDINESVRVFTFTPNPTASPMPLLPTGHHISIRVPSSHIPVEKQTKGSDGIVKDLYRAYTPIYQAEDGSMELLIKVYPGGICTQYLWSLGVGSGIELRGPTGEFHFDSIYSTHSNGTWLMLGGGTGITPMYQVLVPLVQKMVSEESKGKIIVVMASRNEEEILMKEQLQDFVDLYSDYVTVKYIIAQSPSDVPSRDTIVGYLNLDVIRSILPDDFTDRSSIGLVCGPPGFVNAGVGALEKLGFQTGAGKKDKDIFLF